MGPLTPDSRVPLLMERMPIDEITRSKECTTSGNKMKPDGSE